MTLKLSNGVEITITDYTSSSFLLECDTFEEAAAAYQTIAENIYSVSIGKDGETIYSAEGLTADGVQITPTQDGAFYVTCFYHGAKASTDDEYAAIGRILMGEEE